jgi:hypothetical protein
VSAATSESIEVKHVINVILICLYSMWFVYDICGNLESLNVCDEVSKNRAIFQLLIILENGKYLLASCLPPYLYCLRVRRKYRF